jgi:hypothetical protein
MKLVSIELLMQVVRERGVDEIYEILEKVFYAEPLVVIDKDGKAIFTPYDAEELYDYLEKLLEMEVEL